MSVLKGRTVVVTGGGTGIGRACGIALADAGAKVIVSGRREEKVRAVADEYQGPGEIHSHACDVANRDSVRTLFDIAKQQFGQVDLLIHSAGVNIPNRTIAAMEPEQWDKVLRVNATGAYNCMYEVLPAMRERKDGVIVLISSVAGIRASVLGGVAYSASKFAMASLGLTTAREVKDEGVRITNVYPGEVNTPILDGRPVPVSDEHKARILQPEDVAAAVKMVCELPPRAHIPELTIKPTVQDFE